MIAQWLLATTAAKMQTVIPVWLVAVSLATGIISGLLGAWYNARRWGRDEEQRRAEDLRRQEQLAQRICREWTSTPEWRGASDQRIDERISLQFALRARSFVDRTEYEKHEGEVLRRFDRLDEALMRMATVVGELDGRISTQVASQVAAQLMPILTSRVIVRGGVTDDHHDDGGKAHR